METLDENIIILPAHFASENEKNEKGIVCETLGKLGERNSLVTINNSDEFVDKIISNLPPQPENYNQIRQINSEVEKPSFEDQQETEFGPNNCASTK